MKMILRRGTAVFLAVLMTALIIFTAAVTAAETGDRGVKLYRGTFRYTGIKDTFYYTDDYFSDSGNVENEHLRTMSAALAFAVSGTDPQDTLDLMTDIGMETDSIVTEDMVHGTPDTIGTVIAKKQLKDMPLIAVAVRGSDYRGEWASNVRVGSEGDAAGFAEAAAKVSGRIQAYLSANGIAKAKIWVCGYSRAGGVANLVGRAMNENPDAYHTSVDDIYVYTFEAPRCSADDTVYQNICNVLDINDFVPYLCPESWGLHLNGVPVKLGDPDKTVMTKAFSVSADGYVIDYKERSQSLFLAQFDEFLGSTVSREQYASSVEEHAFALCAIYFGKSNPDRQELRSYMTQVGEQIKDDPILKSIITRLWWGIASENDVSTLSTLICDTLGESRETQQPPLSDEEYAALKDAVTPLVRLAVILGNKDGCYRETNETGGKKTVSFYHILTFFTNLDELFAVPHINVNVFEKLKNLDTYYTAGVRIKPGDVIIGETRYTFDDNGWLLEDIVNEAGFTEEDKEIWRSGYELRLDNVLTELPDPDMELYLAASGKFDKSMSMYAFYELSMIKKVGFRSYPVDPSVIQIKLKDNPICLTIPRETAKKCVRYGVVRVDDLGVNHQYRLDTRIEFNENGDALLWVNASYPAVYASAIDDRRYCTTADVDWDDNVTVTDATHIQRHLASMEDFDALQKKSADVDGDGSATVVDVTWIQRWLAKQDVPYPIGEAREL
ncbi:MAG: hypothetical protein IJH07_10410 [Ruminococcus sp.]|nr:hypothetical protein [Ruminococcus sp.]